MIFDYRPTRWCALIALAALMVTLPGCGGGSILPTYELTVVDGQGAGTFSAGTRIEIVAEPIPAGMAFDHWEGDVNSLDSATESPTMLTMPGTGLEIRAVFRDASLPTFTLTVNEGSGGGEFAEGAEITVRAAAAPAGETFDRWIGDTQHLDSADSSAATVTMPAEDVTITATNREKVVPQPPESSWARYVISLENTSYSGNPFELEIDATFTHQPSGAVINMPGYYAGNDTWKVAFMPTKTGTWNWETSSTDSDLDKKTGSYNHIVDGDLLFLAGDPNYPKKWRLSGGPYVIPIALRCEFFCEPATKNEFTDVADFLQEHNILMLETRLLDEKGLFGGRNDYIFEGSWRDHKFDLDIWDRMEERMNILAERGLGAHIMFYSDDGGEPGWDGKSATEALVIRYAVARLAAYPTVVFNTGIDIAEYRSQGDIDWFGDEILENDPYDHPVSSRRGGGSGSITMNARNFESEGDRRAEIDVLRDRYEDAVGMPVSMDDAWGENRGSHSDKDHTAADIRRAFWKCVAAGGVGGLVRGGADGLSATGYFLIESLQSDLESEQWLKFVNPFVHEELGETFGKMEPEKSLATNGHAIADKDRTIIVVHVVGKNDSYDDTSGGDITVNLTGLSGSYSAAWFDPRKGTKTSLSALSAGQSHTLTPPSTDDWVLLLKKS